MDGAGPWKQFTAITLPNLLPTLAVTAVLSLLNTFKVFREAYLVAAVVLLVGAPAAWALSRLQFRGRGVVRGAQPGPPSPCKCHPPAV